MPVTRERIAELKEMIKSGWNPTTNEELDEVAEAIRTIHNQLRGEFQKSPAKKKSTTRKAAAPMKSSEELKSELSDLLNL